jgi:hypothetical protein
VFVGCFFYWAHWLYRIYDQSDLQHQAAMKEQAEFHQAVLAALARVGAGGAVVSPGSNGGASEFVATPTGTNFHTTECAVVANRRGSLRQVSRAEANSMRPCRICDPLKTDTAAGSAAR